MTEPKRTPGQAEGADPDAGNVLEGGAGDGGGKDPQEQLKNEPGRTPGQAEGTEEETPDG